MRKANSHIHEHEHILFWYISSRILTLITHVSSHLMYAGVHHYTHMTYTAHFTPFCCENWGFISFMFQFQLRYWEFWRFCLNPIPQCFPASSRSALIQKKLLWHASIPPLPGDLWDNWDPSWERDETWKMWVLRMCLDPTEFGDVWKDIPSCRHVELLYNTIIMFVVLWHPHIETWTQKNVNS